MLKRNRMRGRIVDAGKRNPDRKEIIIRDLTRNGFLVRVKGRFKFTEKGRRAAEARSLNNPKQLVNFFLHGTP